MFLLNVCKFNGCGIKFPSLNELISHIEETHIDYDPKIVERNEQEHPPCLPLSYVLRFAPENVRKEAVAIVSSAAGAEHKRKLAIKHHSYSISSSNRSNTPTGSEMDDDEMVPSESDSNDSWTTEEFSPEFIMRFGSRHSGSGNSGTPGNEKPFACPVPGCKKRYKNVNGIKYHSKNGHKKEGKVRKGFKCHCGKSYKTYHGLKSHANSAHNSDVPPLTSSTSSLILQRSSSPSLGSLSPSSISNMSSSASSCHGGSSGNLHSGSNNVVQLLTNISPTNGCVQPTAAAANGAGNGISLMPAKQQHHHHHHQHHHQQQQQAPQQLPQFSATVNSNISHQPQISATAAQTTEFSLSLSETYSELAAASSTLTKHQQQPQSHHKQQQQEITTIDALINPNSSAHINTPVEITQTMRAASNTVAFTHSHQATVTPIPTARATPSLTYMPTHSTTITTPTFIEHKYSRNAFREHFLKNMRSKPNINELSKKFLSKIAKVSSGQDAIDYGVNGDVDDDGDDGDGNGGGVVDVANNIDVAAVGGRLSSLEHDFYKNYRNYMFSY